MTKDKIMNKKTIYKLLPKDITEQQRQLIMKSHLETRMNSTSFELQVSSVMTFFAGVATGLWSVAAIKYQDLSPLSVPCLSVGAGIFGWKTIDTYRNVKKYIQLKQELQNIK